MKKSIKILLVAMCVAIISVAFAACDLGYPKVKGNTYEYDKTEYDASVFTGAELASLQTRVASIEAAAAKTLEFRADDDQVYYTTAAGVGKFYSYEQSGANVLLFDAPNKNTNYDGEKVTGYTVSKDNKELLTWHITLMLSDEDKSVDIYLYYNLVTASETPAE